MNDAPNFYTLLDQMAYLEMLEFLMHNQTDVILKIKNQHFCSKVLLRKNPDYYLIYKFNFEDYSTEPAVCSFEVGGDKYFFKAAITSESFGLMLSIPVEIYKLQRRNDFRVSIPESLKYTCVIKTINDRSANIIAEIRDLSLGGCQLVVGQNELKDKDTASLYLKLSSFEWERIRCAVNRIMPIKNENKFYVGLQFLEPSSAFVTDLQSLLVQLDRLHRGKTYE